MDEAIEKLIEEGEKKLQEEKAKKAELDRIKAEKDEVTRRALYESLQAILPLEVQPYFDYAGFENFGTLNSYWINLEIPECTRISIELNPHFRLIEKVLVAMPDNGYKRDSHSVKDLYTALAMARRYYREQQAIKAQMDEYQRQEDEKMAAAAERGEEIASQARNNSIQLDYLQEAIIAASNGDMTGATGYALVGILEHLKGIE